MTFSGILNFTFGFVNGTQVDGAADLASCQDTVDVKWVANGYQLLNNTLDKQGFDAINDFLDITYNIDSVC